MISTTYAHLIEKILPVSTAHLTPAALDELRRDMQARSDDESLLKWDAIIYPHAQYGYLIHLSSEERASGPLARIDEIARSLDCCWVLLDCDAHELPGLETFAH